MRPKPNSYLEGIEIYKQGESGDGSRKYIKLSSNENALGASPKAVLAYKETSSNLALYPDGSCKELREALGKTNQIDSNKIVCGAGSDELIALIITAFANPGSEIIYSEHGFLMYEISARKFGCAPIKAKEKRGDFGYKTDVDEVIKSITDKTKIIFLANPNNPTGSYLNEDELRRLIRGARKDILIVLDSAYHEFVTDKDYPDPIKIVNEFENVIMLRTFSKIYGLAALRIGWSYSANYIADALEKVRGPFNVCAPAQNAALAALKDDEFTTRSKEHNSRSINMMLNEFSSYKGLKAYKSSANFLLIDFFELEKCSSAHQLFMSHDIIVRKMLAYNLPTTLRISVGTDDDNLLVIKALSKFK